MYGMSAHNIQSLLLSLLLLRFVAEQGKVSRSCQSKLYTKIKASTAVRCDRAKGSLLDSTPYSYLLNHTCGLGVNAVLNEGHSNKDVTSVALFQSQAGHSRKNSCTSSHC